MISPVWQYLKIRKKSYDLAIWRMTISKIWFFLWYKDKGFCSSVFFYKDDFAEFRADQSLHNSSVQNLQ